MPIIASDNTKKIPPHPADQFAGRCIDVIDLGMVDVTYPGRPPRKQHKIVIRFWCGQYGKDEEGKTIPLFAGQRFTLSLHENATLRGFLETWRSQKFTADELKGFDLEKLIGIPAFLDIQHSTKPDGRVYANIMGCLRLPKTMEAPPMLEGYVRSKDRTDDDQAPEQHREPGDDDDELPF